MTPTPSAEDIKKILATLDPYQASQLRSVLKAFVDVLDGIQAHELPEMTGLNQDRCDAVSEARFAAASALSS